MGGVQCPDLTEATIEARPERPRWIEALVEMRRRFQRNTFFEKACGRRRLPEAL